jgi:hypothetical protein
MKNQKKGKTEASSSRRAPRTRALPSSPQVLHITAGPPRSRNRLQSAPAAAVAARCQELYVTARTTDSNGRIQLDRERLADALAEAGIGALAEQALYSLALMSAADGNAALFEADVIAALERTALFDTPGKARGLGPGSDSGA